MQLNIIQNIAEGLKQIDIKEFMNELIERLEKMEQELVVDRLEGNIAICEDRKTGKIKQIERSELPENIKEGSVLTFENGKYQLDNKKQEEISKRIEEKMNNLWK